MDSLINRIKGCNQMFELIQLNKHGGQHLYIQLYQQLRNMIEEGILTENQKLPPIRQMAKLLAVNNGTIVNAYKLLGEEGLIYQKIGSGTYVASLLQKLELEERFLDEEIQLMNQGQLPWQQNMISFASLTPAADLFPIADVKAAINHVLDRDGGEVFGYQDSLGYFSLRETFQKYLQRKEIDCQIKDIQVVSGAQQGIDILAKALLQHGDVVFVEEPTYTGAISAFKSRGARIVSIPIREDGIDLEILEDRLAEYTPKFFYGMTIFQNPTGYTYTTEKKAKLLEISQRWNLMIVEDDSFSELHFTDKKNLPLRALADNDRLIYIKSFSKIFLPGFRIAFLVLPNTIINQVMAAKHTSDISSSGLVQRTFDLLLRKGLWEKHLEGMRQIYCAKYEVFSKLLQEGLPKAVDYRLPRGGLNFWLALPEGYSTDLLYKKCLAVGVIIVPGSIFFPDGRPNNLFRLSIAAVEAEEMRKGLGLLFKTITELLAEERSENQLAFRPLM